MYFRGKKKYAKEVSLYEPIGTDKEGNQIQLVDVVVSEDVDVVECLDTNQKIQRLLEIMPMALSVRECEIIEKPDDKDKNQVLRYHRYPQRHSGQASER